LKFSSRKKPDVLKRILAQAKRPLKDAAAVNSTRWALLNRLKEIGLPVSTGSGGKLSTIAFVWELPKRHYIDAACVVTLENRNATNQPLLIKATGHGTRQMCRTDKFWVSESARPQDKFVRFSDW
jgi:hypothetical protein